MKKAKSNMLFTISFVGEYVEILLSLNRDSNPVAIRGYLMEHDDEFIYLGLDNKEVNSAIKKVNIISIEINDEKNELKKYLNEINVPSNKLEGN